MPSFAKPLARLVLLLGLAACVIGVRLFPRHDLLQSDGVLLSDLDTQRRLARLEAIDAAAGYPVREVHDGWPAGTTLHWTLPMDWVIRALDPLVGWMIPGARGYEGGAVLAGPLLALLAVGLYAWLAMRLLGAGAGLLAALLYGWWYPFVNTSLLGNGDHQTLQQVAAAVATLAILRALRAGTPAGRWAGTAGAAIGFAVWVSTELMLYDYAFVLALTVAAAWPWRDPEVAARCRGVLLPFAGAALALMLVGHVLEHRDDLGALRWDSVSWFQVWQAAVFVLFAGLLRWGPLARRGAVAGFRSSGRALTAGAVAVAAGCLPFLFAGARAAVAAQMHDASVVSVWLHHEVSEFRSLAFDGGDGRGLTAQLLGRDGWLVLLLPVALALVGWAALRPRGAPAAVAGSRPAAPQEADGPAGIDGAAALVLVLLSVSTFALYAWEVKLGHLFALTSPLLLVAGWRIGWQIGWQRLAGAPRRWCDLVAAGLALATVFVRLPQRNAMARQTDRIVHEVCGILAGRRGDGDFGVLAPWSMGAPLLYDAKVGAVATGYHRNLEGIADGFRFWLSDVDERAAAMEILHRRRVRYVVAWFDRLFLKSGAETIGRPPLRTEREILPAATRTMFWQLRYGRPAGFRLVQDGPLVQLTGAPEPEPIYRIYEVVE